MMTKKDYVRFADMIAENKIRLNHEIENNSASNISLGFKVCLDNFTNSMIQLFQSDNPNFNASRFNNYIENKVKKILDSVQ